MQSGTVIKHKIHPVNRFDSSARHEYEILVRATSNYYSIRFIHWHSWNSSIIALLATVTGLHFLTEEHGETRDHSRILTVLEKLKFSKEPYYTYG